MRISISQIVCYFKVYMIEGIPRKSTLVHTVCNIPLVYCEFAPFFARVQYCSFSASQKPSFGSLTAYDWLKTYRTVLCLPCVPN